MNGLGCATFGPRSSALGRFDVCSNPAGIGAKAEKPATDGCRDGQEGGEREATC